MTEQPRDQVGKSTRGRWETTPLTGNDVALTPERPRTGAETILDAALARQRAADAEVTNATLSVIAQKVRQICPDAVYLTLDEDHEYGARVRAGSLLDADFEPLEDEISDLDHPEAFTASAEVELLLGRLDGLASTDVCPAISDQFADDSAWSATGERRLHLETAARLTDDELAEASEEDLVDDALLRADGATSYQEATTILTTALTSCVAALPRCEAFTGWRLDPVMDDFSGMWAYDNEIAVRFDDEDEHIHVEETFNLDRTPAGDLVYAIYENLPVSGQIPPTIHWGTSSEENR